MKKRLFAGLLALCMTVNLMSATAFATETSTDTTVAEVVCSELEGCSESTHVDACAITVAAKAAEECGLGYNLVAGANISGFMKVAQAMMAQGIV